MMNGLFKKFLLPMLLAVVFISGCKEDDETPILSVSGSDIVVPDGGGTPQISISELGGTSEITISCNEKWRISNSAAWLEISQASGESGTHTVELNAEANTTGSKRTATLTVSSDNGQSRRLVVSQVSQLYPSYNLSPIPPDATGMNSTAVELAAKMHLGINFGNTMEAPTEAEWVNSKITESYVKFVKQIGFNSVRLPTGWVKWHLSDRAKAKIDPAWLNRVKEVVGWCVANDMYVMLNVHGDWGWLENNVNATKKDSVNAMQKAIWEQIATTMRDFDEHLIFAGTNEPVAEDAEHMAILDSYHQTFVNAVRSTGGRNSHRVLVVQGPRTNGELTYKLMNTLPTDNVPNKLMVEIHNYTPATFTLVTDGDVSWGNMIYYWGAGNDSTIEPERNAEYGEEDEILDEFQKMKQKFIDKGIPVMLGEYATWRRSPGLGKPEPKDMEMHNKSVDYWSYYVTKQAKAHGLVPFWWEIGFMLDRANNVVKDQAMLDAILEGAK
ncbi:cellulase family glycosylhydrolase [Ohtaekwangia koreensis]|uniref:Putative binding domain-containing protein, N-terminal n=1 Tax=Ohtaekwangia koreensis TaxID=688867 RepID=A0A1T5KIZ9_9BACT|nr:cellulase family glycosylhydrolase [Ohtaekwangia koreensis]SKC63716.1 Putative binding domain-containing protein, N-terminal [Ohtaekwangia koreensis]